MFTEGNSWQHSWFVPQDVYGLINAHGGEQKFALKLDSLFTVSSQLNGSNVSNDISGLVGQYAHGNEPSHHMAYLYNYTGSPQRTRELAKHIMDEFYHDAPDGLIGNEDCGQMSAWYVMSALGLYQIAPGIEASYELGYPLFDRADIALPNGRKWIMSVDTSTSYTPKADGVDLGRYQTEPLSVDHSELLGGGGLAFNRERVAYKRSDIPTILDGVYIKEHGDTTCSRPGAPIIEAASSVFTDSLLVKVIGHGTCTVTENGATRSVDPCVPFYLHANADVYVEWSSTYAPVTAHFTITNGNLTLKLDSKYANQYAAGGDQALVDGLRGGTDFRTGEWQGYQGQDVLATMDLGEVKKLKRAGLSVLQDQGSWIWYPSEVTFAWSTNGRTWSSTTVENTVDRKADGGQMQELWSEAIGKKARYIKVMAKNAGPCPDWHIGKGGASWIFADEILIETE